jgi:hypothetical protein
MTRRHILVSLAAISVAGCDLANTTITGKRLPNYRYKLTVEVDTPAGVRIGSSVIEVIKPWRSGSRYRGQAVAVDLPEGEILFVLPRSEKMGLWGAKAMIPAFPEIIGTGDEEKDVTQLLSAARAMGRVPLPRRWQLSGPQDTMDHTPYFVRFRDISDPKSVEQVDPDNLGKSVGPGVRLNGIFIEITDEPVSTGIERKLPWLRKVRGKLLDGSEIMTSNVLSNKLGAGDFSTFETP